MENFIIVGIIVVALAAAFFGVRLIEHRRILKDKESTIEIALDLNGSGPTTYEPSREDFSALVEGMDDLDEGDRLLYRLITNGFYRRGEMVWDPMQDQWKISAWDADNLQHTYSGKTKLEAAMKAEKAIPGEQP
jgi:hypothetical protein